MSHVIIARRYAQALKEEAEGLNTVEQVDEDVVLIRESLEASTELVQFFESPIISREKKSRVVKALFDERVSNVTLKFLLLMVDKKREHIFPDVVNAYKELRDRQLGVVNVTVRVPSRLSKEEEGQLVTTVENMTGKQVRLEISIDESLLGGLVVRIGDKVYDGSFSNQLAALRERLESGHYSLN